MKFTGISMAVLMLLAIVLKSLPDSVFNYFHEHDHYAYSGIPDDGDVKVQDHKHNCKIEDWNYESFEVSENQFGSILSILKQPSFVIHEQVQVSASVLQIGRGPPAI